MPDLTLPLVDEKSPLPAIIVTPSSPRSVTDFSIAFLAPRPNRHSVNVFLLSSALHSPSLLRLRRLSHSLCTETTIIVTFNRLSRHGRCDHVLVVHGDGCHVITHRMAAPTTPYVFESPGLGLGEHSTTDLGMYK